MGTVNYISGLDLGRRSQYTALAVAEQTRDEAGLARYAVRELRRWPPGAGHAAVLADVLGLFAAPPLAGSTLVIDGTAAGASVVEMFRRCGLGAHMQEALITAGHAVSKDETGGALRVARAQLASALVALGASRRLQVVRTLPLRAAFERELEAFTARPAPAGDEQVLADPRVGQHDHLVLAVALPCCYGERYFVGGWEPTVDPDNQSLLSRIPSDVWDLAGLPRPW